MADLMREKREALARKLAQQHPEVEEFEAAGGDVEDLAGNVSAEKYDADYLSSLKGGETMEQAEKTAWDALQEPSLNKRVAKGWDEGGLEYSWIRSLLQDLEKKGSIEFKDPALKRAIEVLSDPEFHERGKGEREKVLNLWADLARRNEEGPGEEFRERAKKYGKPGEEYREEGGE